jgi:hypothetical protein
MPIGATRRIGARARPGSVLLKRGYEQDAWHPCQYSAPMAITVGRPLGMTTDLPVDRETHDHCKSDK